MSIADENIPKTDENETDEIIPTSTILPIGSIFNITEDSISALNAYTY